MEKRVKSSGDFAVVLCRFRWLGKGSGKILYHVLLLLKFLVFLISP